MSNPLRPLALFGTAVVALGVGGVGLAGPAAAETEVGEPATFTSAFTVMATPDQVVADGEPVGGAPGATGTFSLRINSDLDIVCYDITTTGVEPPYESAAKTSTHVHESGAGDSGPPRLAFPDPEGSGDTRTSSGCLQGPFTTGLDDETTGEDTGAGFTLAQIEADPSGFAADVHTSQFVPGAVRGQLRQMPVGGVDTGGGGTAPTGSAADLGDGGSPWLVGGLALLAAGGAGVALHRRTTA